jgi:GDP-L-fucose synthase
VQATSEYEDPDPVNLGAGREVRIKELVELIGELTGYTGEIVWDTTKPDGQPRRMLDTSRAQERFGWTAQIPLEEGLRATIAWWEREGRQA